ncbi:8-amino-7-oxononanoate synthase [Vampirovibrio chlorellavorus]|uniref:8-amino-7-oxononanoate synthase n=1 Tax=Vampirovibrio chlorellavorus TaxID=758823 RepID=UPI0026F16DA2|nr:8-amino-7-oxononanoate synthase [Vampirovibrio chlorellavorus]
MAGIDLSLLAGYQAALAQKAQVGQLRRCRELVWTPEAGPMAVRVEGQPAINFSSNDYLGWARHPRLQAAAVQAVEQFGTGSTASRLIGGTNPLVLALESKLAAFKHAEAALVFNSGYQANVAILQAILGPDDYVFADRLNHASLIDGCLLSKAHWSRYRHLDLGHLAEKLAKAPAEARKWVITDSVFSMDGDYPDLKALVDVAERYGALVMVDEAHATGLFGHGGAGLCQQFGVSDRVALQMGTFSKALGGSGAYVAGPQVLIDWLVNQARGFIYSTAQSPTVLGASLAALDLLQEEPVWRERLWRNVRTLEQAVRAHGLQDWIPLPLKSAIVPVLIGDSVRTVAMSEALLAAGYFVQGIRPPTVPPKTARLRIALSAAHTEAQIESLCAALATLLRVT